VSDAPDAEVSDDAPVGEAAAVAAGDEAGVEKQ
jgi:hypothetical protein